MNAQELESHNKPSLPTAIAPVNSNEQTGIRKDIEHSSANIEVKPTGHSNSGMSHTLIVALCLVTGLCVESLILHAHFALQYSTQLEDSDDSLRKGFSIYDSIHRAQSYSWMPGVKTKLSLVLGDLKSLAEGKLKISARWEAYEIDREFVDRLQSGQCLMATVPTSDDLVEQLTNNGFLKLEESLIQARRRGVKVKRLYYVKDEPVGDIDKKNLSESRDLENYGKSILYDHLKKLVSHGIEVKFIIKSDSPSATLLRDYMVFGEDAVSEGELDPHEWSRFNTTYQRDENVVKTTKANWEFLWNANFTQVFRVKQKLDSTNRDLVFEKKHACLKVLSDYQTADSAYRAIVNIGRDTSNRVEVHEHPISSYLADMDKVRKRTQVKAKRLYLNSNEEPIDEKVAEHLTNVSKVADVKLLTSKFQSEQRDEFCFGDVLLLQVEQNSITLSSCVSDIEEFFDKWNSTGFWEHPKAVEAEKLVLTTWSRDKNVPKNEENLTQTDSGEMPAPE